VLRLHFLPAAGGKGGNGGGGGNGNTPLSASPAGEGQLPGVVNYYLGKDPGKWATGIPTYARVHCASVYPGIDLVYYGGGEGDGRRLEYDLIVAPGADPTAVRLRLTGAVSIAAASAGSKDLSLTLPDGGTLLQAAPVLYQMKAGKKVAVSGRYVIQKASAPAAAAQAGTDGPEIGFTLDANAGYDPTLPLVIDPTLVYSSYLGGTSMDYAYGVAVDASGNAFVTGYTGSTNFMGASGNHGGYDAFIAKLSPGGTQAFTTYYVGGSVGGSGGNDYGQAITLDSAGNPHVTGYTAATDFPIVVDTAAGATQVAQSSLSGGNGGVDAYVVKLSGSTGAIIHSTYLGGTGTENGFGIAVDSAGAAYVVGSTTSASLPNATGTYKTSYGGGNTDGFVIKLSPDGSTISWSTFIGGTGEDKAFGVAVDPSGNPCVTGYVTAASSIAATPGAYQTSAPAGVNAFVLKLNPATGTALYASYLGGSGDDYGQAIAVDASGDLYIAGKNRSGGFPTTPGAYQTSAGGAGSTPVHGFVAKVRPVSTTSGGGLLWATYLNGTGTTSSDGETRLLGIAVDGASPQPSVYLAGYTDEPTYPVYPLATAAQTVKAAGYDAVFSKLRGDGAVLLYSTFLGGAGTDEGAAISATSGGDAWVVGWGNSTAFPVTGGGQGTLSGAGTYDAFAAKFAADPTSTGNEYWLAFPGSENLPHSPPKAPLELVLTITADASAAATGTVTVPGLSWTSSFFAPAGGKTTVIVPSGAEINSNDAVDASSHTTALASFGVHVTADQPISVSGLLFDEFESDSFLALPVSALGTDYYALVMNHCQKDMQVTVVAAQDNTHLAITPTIACGNGRAANVTFPITLLHAGDTYQLRANNFDGDLSGTRITSTDSPPKPFAVFSGNDGVYVSHPYGDANMTVEQLPSVDRWGTEFLAIPLATRQRGDFFRAVAAYDGTAITVNGSLVATLNRGQAATFGPYDGMAPLPSTILVSAPLHVTSNWPILLAQVSTGANFDNNPNADPFMALVPAVTQYLPRYTLAPTHESWFPNRFINVVAPSSAVAAGILFDGTALPASAFTDIRGSGYLGAQLALPSGAHTLASANGMGFGVEQYAYSQYGASSQYTGLYTGFDGYGHVAGLSLPPNTAPVPNTPPIVFITQPADGAIQSPGPVTVVATASDSDGINRVVFDVLDATEEANGTIVQKQTVMGSGTSGTYSVTFSGLSNGGYYLRATAYDNRGTAASAQVFFGIQNFSNPVPTVNMTQPADNAKFRPAPASIPVAATATDSDGIASIVFTLKNSATGQQPLPPQNASLSGSGSTFTGTATFSSVPAGTYTIVAQATDSLGAATTSAPVHVMVVNGTSNNPPSVSITSPADGAKLGPAPASVPVAASASDSDGYITGVTFTLTDPATNTTVQQKPGTGSSDGSGAWSAAFNNVAEGTYTIVAQATDDDHVTTTSAPITITVEPDLGNGTPPAAPSNLSATATSYKEIDLSWTDNSGNEDGFTIERRLTSDASLTAWKPVATVPANTTSYQDTNGLNPGTSYSYHVRAFNQFGVSEWCNEASATTQAYAGSGTPYLADLTLDRPGIREGETATATVTLSAPAPTGGTTITLLTDKPTAVTLGSSSLSIPAGTLSASFAVTARAGGAAGGGNVVSLSAKSGTWVQATKITVVASTLSSTVQHVTATAGNQTALVEWSALPPAFVQGYRVYRVNAAGVATLLTPQPIGATIFAESGLTGGQSYTYRVGAVDWNGGEALSPSISVVPAATGPTLAWAATPITMEGTRATFHVQSSANIADFSRLHLIVDGADAGTFNLPPSDSTDPSLYTSIDTSGLPNGIHTAQVIGGGAGDAAATPPMSFSVQNAISEAYASSTVSGSTADAALVRAVVDGVAPPWTVTIIHEDLSNGTVSTVRTWNGVGNRVRVAWDGTDDQGNTLASGEYTILLSIPPGGNQAIQWLADVWHILGYPTAVALVGDIDKPDTIVPLAGSGQVAGSATRQHRNAIILAYQKMQQQGNLCELYAPPPFRFYLSTQQGGIYAQEQRAGILRLIDYLENSVQDFYLYGHSNGGKKDKISGAFAGKPNTDWIFPPKAGFGDCWFDSVGDPALAPNQTDPGYVATFPEADIVFTHDMSKHVKDEGEPYFVRISSDRIYNFVWIDGCNSAGGHIPKEPDGQVPYVPLVDPPYDGMPAGPTVTNWRDTFNIGAGGNANEGKITTFMAWSGEARQDVSKDNSQSPWAYWRNAFWDEVSVGGRQISVAIANATSRTMRALNDGKITKFSDTAQYPWYVLSGVPRLFIDGDGSGAGFLPGIPGF
jgi:hypothetical protein